jgi:CrcB protein
MHWIAIFLGGGLGAMARFAVSSTLLVRAGDAFPWGTLVVNGAGCFAIGIVAALFTSSPYPQPLRLFVVTGVLGGFTTFSAFGLETTELFARGDTGPAVLYVLGSVGGGLVAVGLGLGLGRMVAS